MDNRKSILIVDDDHNFRRVMTRILDDLDYELLAAGDADQALAMCRGHEGDIDLLIVDLVLPGMSGPELIAEMVELYPDVKVIKVSGMMDLSDSPALNAGRQFLKKPFDAATLRAKVQLALGHRP
jgi:DNA-binding NtrC family response regulator